MRDLRRSELGHAEHTFVPNCGSSCHPGIHHCDHAVPGCGVPASREEHTRRRLELEGAHGRIWIVEKGCVVAHCVNVYPVGYIVYLAHSLPRYGRILTESGNSGTHSVE